MKDAEYLREEYNKRFSGAAGRWTSENLYRCTRLVRRVIRWTHIHPEKVHTMLDVGCATGFYTRAFNMQGFDAYGLDYSEVAVSKATDLHPECHFIHADGFNPDLKMKFDLIFCRGFSGANTHDLSFVAEWTNKYIPLLTDGGKFVFSYSSDFSGTEAEGEIVNWSRKEIKEYINLITARCLGVKIYYEYYLVSRLFLVLTGILKKKVNKRYFYIIFAR